MVRHVAMATIGFLTVAPLAFAGGVDDRQVMKPLHAASIDVGQRHFVSFCTTADRHCDLTVMSVTRMSEEDASAHDDVQRLRLLVDPASSARIDAPNAGVLDFACASDGSRMVMTALRRVAAD